jgi:hypothetical protein
LSSVDLPTPFGPTSATRSPRFTRSERPSSTVRPSKPFFRPSTSTTCSAPGRPGAKRIVIFGSDARGCSNRTSFSSARWRLRTTAARAAFARKRLMKSCCRLIHFCWRS